MEARQKTAQTTHIALLTAEDVVKIRHQLHLTQQAFAALMGVSVDTLRNLEQGRRRPHSSARSLLRIADNRLDFS